MSQAEVSPLQPGRAVVKAATLFVGCMAGLVLLGWLLNVPQLKSIVPGLTTMKANTALGLGLTAAAVWLSRTVSDRSRYSLPVWLLTGLVSAMAVLTLLEYASGWNFAIDEFLVRDLDNIGTANPPGRFAPGTGYCLLLLSAALMVVDSWPRISHALTLITALVALVGLIGYVDNLPSLYGAGRYTSLAIHTVIGLLSLSAAMLAVRPYRGITALVVRSGGQGSALTPLLTGAIFLPIVLGAISLRGERASWYGNEFGLALFSVLLIVLTVALVWVTGAERLRIDAKRMQAEKELHQLNLDLENRVQQRMAELRAANQELEAFSYSVSHDLRAPLRSIDGFSQFLIEDHAEQLDEEGKSYLGRIRANVQRMGQLITDLLALARLSRVELQRQPVELSSMVTAIIAELRLTNPERIVEVEVEPELTAHADPQLLRVALENLLGNAWKFTGKTTAGRIVFGKVPDDFVYFIRDNGAGFDMKYANRLFAPFQRLHDATQFEGTGIGLATVQRIIYRHGGQIRAEGQPGEGATFFFSLG